MRSAVLIAALALASCSGQTAETTLPAPTLTSLPPATAPPTSTETPSTSSSAATTTTTTTTSLPPDAAAEFGLSQVVFGDIAYVALTNWGNDVGTLDGLWLGQDSKSRALPDVEVPPGGQALVGLATEPPPDLIGVAAVSHLGAALGTVSRAGGELALYDGDPAEDGTVMVGYVAWGNGPHPLAQPAANTGIWDNSSVEIIDDTPSISTGIYPARQASDWGVDLGG